MSITELVRRQWGFEGASMECLFSITNLTPSPELTYNVHSHANHNSDIKIMKEYKSTDSPYFNFIFSINL